MTVASVFPRLEALLPLVSKPVQYVGGELNAVVKPWDSVAVVPEAGLGAVVLRSVAAVRTCVSSTRR